MNFLKGVVASGKAVANAAVEKGKDLASDIKCASPDCKFTQTKLMTGIKSSLLECVECKQQFCNNCVFKLTNTHEEDMSIIDEKYASSGGGARQKFVSAFEGKFVCALHKDKVVNTLMEKFCTQNCQMGDKCCNEYLSDEKQKQLYDKPPLDLEEKSVLSLWSDTIIDVGLAVAKVSGVSFYAKAAYAIYKAGGVMELVMDPQLYALISPIVQRMEEDDKEDMNVKDGDQKESAATRYLNNVIATYYLSLVHNQRNNSAIALQLTSSSTEEGVVSPVCPVALIDTLGEYMGIAEWLYFSIKSGHRESALKWYLGKLVWAQGWTLLIATNQSVSFVNGFKNPAFCLAARNTPASGKELILSIRGSSEQTDWWINANESPFEITFEGVRGHIHGGMYSGILAILDNFGTRKQITEFVKRGYRVTVVGHSLGAGSSMLCAMELLNHFRREAIPNAETKVKAVAYATPAVASEAIADKVAQLGWITAVYGNDVVPRISLCNTKKLAKEVKDFLPTSERWYAADVASAKEVLKKSGSRSSDVLKTLDDSVAGDEVMVKEAGAQTSQNVDFKGILLVPPGRIVYMTQRGSVVGGYGASEITHRHPDMRKIILITSEMVEDHGLENYMKAIRGTRFSTVYPAKPACEMVHIGSSTTVEPDLSKRVLCQVCDLSTTWPARFQNDSTRQEFTNYCSLCRRVVCVVCAPAGDEVPKEGITQEIIKLGDLRIPVLSKGIPKTRRLCIHCYLDGYKVL